MSSSRPNICCMAVGGCASGASCLLAMTNTGTPNSSRLPSARNSAVRASSNLQAHWALKIALCSVVHRSHSHMHPARPCTIRGTEVSLAYVSFRTCIVHLFKGTAIMRSSDCLEDNAMHHVIRNNPRALLLVWPSTWQVWWSPRQR